MAIPAIPRGSIGNHAVENIFNRVLRIFNPGLQTSAAGQVLTSTGSDLTWQAIPYPSLTHLTNALTADVLLNNTATWFTGPQVAQGTTGIWLAMGKLVLTDAASNSTMAARLTDGTTVVDTGIASTPFANSAITLTLSGIFSSPAGNIHLDGLDGSTINGKILHNATGDGVSSTLTVVRIG